MNPETPFTERVAAGIGALFVLGTLGFLIYQGACHLQTEPELHVEALSVTSVGSTYRVEVRVSNTGSEPAGRVVIQGELGPVGGVVEDATVTIDYVPGQSHVDAALIFTTDPRRYALRVRPVGFASP